MIFFFACQVQGINTPGFPLFCLSPLIYKQDTKVPLFLPSMAFLIQTSFLFGVLFLTSIRFFPFLHGPRRLFVFRFLTFFFSISELFLSTGNNPPVSLPFHFAPCLWAPRIIRHLCFYLFLFSQLLFLYLWPPFPLLASPVSIAMPFDQTSSPYSLLRAIVACSAPEWSKKGQDRDSRTVAH